jgi:hypothetical protein
MCNATVSATAEHNSATKKRTMMGRRLNKAGMLEKESLAVVDGEGGRLVRLLSLNE